MEGEIPTKQLRLVLAWMEIHKEEILANWKLCQNGEKPFQIESLKYLSMYFSSKKCATTVELPVNTYIC
jgi:hypothetical protein